MAFFRRDDFIKSTTGQATAGAHVYVCNQPANVTLGASEIISPPSPLSTIYSDSAGTMPITQPIVADGFGHTFFYTAQGFYTVVVANTGVIQEILPDQAIGVATSITLETNGSQNTDQALLNLIAGTSVSLTADGSGGVTIAVTGISSAFNNLTSGTNTTAAMVVGTGASIEITGSGIIEASQLWSVVISSAAPSSGQYLKASSSTAAAWATLSVAVSQLASVEGNGSKVQLTNQGSTTNGDVVTYDGNGNVQDSGTLLSSLAHLSSPTFTGTVTVSGLTITGALTDVNSSTGTSGQVLSSTGTGVAWTSTSVNTQSGTPYQAAFSDNNNVIVFTDASAVTFTIPANATVAFPVGAILTAIQYGAGQVTISPAGGVTIQTPSSLTSRAQYSTVSVVQVSANTWVAGGDLT